MRLSGWGRFPVQETTRLRPRDEAAIAPALAAGPLIARGNGRAYGDSAVGARTLDMRAFDRMISFEDGLLVAEAGVLLADVIATFLPRGWFPFVTPGTKFVTLGGMIAADVHGKNHHAEGSLRDHLAWIELIGPDGALQRCSPTENAELFHWTVGGMGLTGVILRAGLRLRPVETAWIRQTTHPAPDLAHAMALFEENAGATYSVAWIDCLATEPALGRSLVMLGEHAGLAELDARRRAAPFETPAKRRRSVPFDAPGRALNRYSVRAFNGLYYRAGQRRAGTSLVDWDSYFYPLDAVLHWNRIYGRKGLVQFQCVLPLARSEPGIRRLLEEISAAGHGSFLAVLKRFGAQDSPVSFPMEGYTLALDFPVSEAVLRLLDRLDPIVAAHGGRFYLAKDARLRADTLRATDPRTEGFAAMRRAQGLAPAFASFQSERLSL